MQQPKPQTTQSKLGKELSHFSEEYRPISHERSSALVIIKEMQIKTVRGPPWWSSG